jgi:hypothetical protein
LNTSSNDPFRLHRASLEPFRGGAKPQSNEAALREGQSLGASVFLEFLRSNSLAPLWHQVLRESDLLQETDPNLREGLGALHHQSIASYLLQQHLCAEVDRVCQTTNKIYAVFKGAQIRESLYDEPALRPAGDVDVLIAQEDRAGVIEAFEASGFQLRVNPKNRTHEVTLTKGQAIIDLHWHILRPGRTREAMSDHLLARRVRLGSMWVLDDAACLFVMLVHPVITEHLNSKHSLLIHLVDLQRWLATRQVDWEAVVDLLDLAGLAPAAWCMLTWLQMMMPESATLEIMHRLEPSPARQRYLRRWIEQRSTRRIARLPFTAQAAFTLAIHDKPWDAGRALGGRVRSQIDRIVRPSSSLRG